MKNISILLVLFASFQACFASDWKHEGSYYIGGGTGWYSPLNMYSYNGIKSGDTAYFEFILSEGTDFFVSFYGKIVEPISYQDNYSKPFIWFRSLSDYDGTQAYGFNIYQTNSNYAEIQSESGVFTYPYLYIDGVMGYSNNGWPIFKQDCYGDKIGMLLERGDVFSVMHFYLNGVEIASKNIYATGEWDVYFGGWQEENAMKYNALTPEIFTEFVIPEPSNFALISSFMVIAFLAIRKRKDVK